MTLRKLVQAIVLAVATLSATHAFAVQPDEVLDDPTLEARARALSAGLRCLVCQNQSIDDSDAPLAKDLRVLVRERLKTGDTDDEIISFVVSRYGEFVLLKPRFTPHTWLLWLATPLLFLLAMGGILYASRRRAADSVRPESLSESEQAHLDALLKQEPAREPDGVQGEKP